VRTFSRVLSLLLLPTATTACRPSVSPAPSTSSSSSPAAETSASHPPHPPRAALEAELSAASLRDCIPSPPLVRRPGCELRGKVGENPAFCADFVPAGSPEVDVLTLIVAPAPFDFAAALGFPSMQTALDAGTPELASMKDVYRDFEGPHWRPLADGRRARLEARGLMLGGVVHWATLQSPQATFDTVVIRYLPLHDSPLTDSDRSAVTGWDLPGIAQCLDAVWWRKPLGP
jgi:hypothetical protein